MLVKLIVEMLCESLNLYFFSLEKKYFFPQDPLDLSGVSSGSILPDDNTSDFGPHERTDDDIAESPGHNFQTAAQPFRVSPYFSRVVTIGTLVTIVWSYDYE